MSDDAWEPPARKDGDRHPVPERGPWDSYGWQVQPPPPQSGTDGFAIAALILGIIPLFAGLLGIVFGFVSLSRVKRSRQGGRRLALAGIICGSGWIAVVATAAALGAFQQADRDRTGAITSPGSVGAADLQVGDCVSKLPEGTVYDVAAVPCGNGHMGEVYDRFDLTGEAFPGAQSVQRQVEEHCASTLAQYVDAPSRGDGYDVYYVAPIAGSWRRSKSAMCLLASDDSSVLLGSAKRKGVRAGQATPSLPPGQLSGVVSFDDVEVGHCLVEARVSDTGTVDVVPCRTPHLAEVFSVFELPAGPYPGDERVEALVLGHCRTFLPGFVRAPAGRTGYSLSYFMPDRASWPAGDRFGVCMVTDPQGDKLTAEAKAKGRHT